MRLPDYIPVRLVPESASKAQHTCVACSRENNRLVINAGDISSVYFISTQRSIVKNYMYMIYNVELY